MRRIAVISTDNNPNYFFYIPIVEWAWGKFGWDVVIFRTLDIPELTLSYFKPSKTEIYDIPIIEGVRPGTCAQTVRHFVADVLPRDAYWMVQDIDLIPLAPWNPDLTKRTIYGWELTGHSFIPVHYTGMTGDKWYELMDCTGDLKADMEREMKANGRAYKEKWEEYWDTDWDILTQKVLKRRHEFTFIPRGMVKLGQYYTAQGRIDRCSIEVNKITGEYSWGYTLNQPTYIDMHCENNCPADPDKWKMIRAVLVKVFGEIPEWMDEYVKQHHEKYEK